MTSWARLPRILCVEDDLATLRMLRLSLQRLGFDADGVESWREAADSLNSKEYDAILLDRGLPDGDAVERVRDLRAQGNTTGVIMFTGRASSEEMAEAYAAGVNHVMPKPQTADQVASQLKRILHETKAIPLMAGPLVLDARAGVVTTVPGGRPKRLSPQAVDILWELMMRPGEVVTREYLVARVGRRKNIGSDFLSVQVHLIRAALGPGHRKLVRTLRGGGLVFCLQHEEGALARTRSPRVAPRARRTKEA